VRPGLPAAPANAHDAPIEIHIIISTSGTDTSVREGICIYLVIHNNILSRILNLGPSVDIPTVNNISHAVIRLMNYSSSRVSVYLVVLNLAVDSSYTYSDLREQIS
jgi:hypothetical protein